MHCPTIGPRRTCVHLRDTAAFRERQVWAMQVAFSACPKPLLHDSLTICSCNFDLLIAWNIFSCLCARYAIHATDVLQQTHPVPIPFTLLLPYICARPILSLFIGAINHSMVTHIKKKKKRILICGRDKSFPATEQLGKRFFFFCLKLFKTQQGGFFYLYIFIKRTCKCVRGEEMGNSQLLSSC